LKVTPAGSEASQRQLTRLPLPERTLITPRSSRSICRPGPEVGGWEVGGGLDGGGLEGGGLDGGGLDDGGALVGVTPPVQVVPFSANDAGVPAVPEPLKPKLVLALVPSALL
jgi:hypothetical protein